MTDRGKLRLARTRSIPVDQLATFFTALVDVGTDVYFHPHPLTRDAAARVVAYEGRDVYVVALLEGEIVGYGMLRGWDEGYDVPSLGLAVAPARRRTGVGEWLIGGLHRIARDNGARCVRLSVSEENTDARRLYERLGYEFSKVRDGVEVGYCILDTVVGIGRSPNESH